jgi:hypothetical protein
LSKSGGVRISIVDKENNAEENAIPMNLRMDKRSRSKEPRKRTFAFGNLSAQPLNARKPTRSQKPFVVYRD